MVKDWARERNTFTAQIKELQREKDDLEIETAELQRTRDVLARRIDALRAYQPLE
jgi:FtsZ-binding cell division protein ZapB